jgi:hypothetical protein
MSCAFTRRCLSAWVCICLFAAPAWGRDAPARSVTTRARVSYIPAAAALTPLSTLAAPDGGAFGEVAAATHVIAGPSLAPVIVPGETFGPETFDLGTSVYVFDEPAAGWSGSTVPARLTASDGHQFERVVVSDNTAVVGDASLGLPSLVTAYLFQRPSGGWSGDRQQSATLVGSGPGTGGRAELDLAIAGRTVFTSDGPTIYAFSRPPAGWSGTRHQSARLIAPGAGDFLSIAVSGRTLVATTFRAIRVFTEPARGWTGIIHPAASIRVSDRTFSGLDGPVAISGRTIVAAGSPSMDGQYIGAYVFHEPARGWQSPGLRPTILRIGYRGNQLGPTVAVSGDTIALATAAPGLDHYCPCTDDLYALFNQAGAWLGGITLGQPSANLSPAESPAGIAISGQTRAASSDDGIHTYAASGPFRITDAALTHIARSAPRLSFTADAGNHQEIDSLTVSLPRSLMLATGRDAAHAVRILGARSSNAALRPSGLALTFTNPSPRVSIIIGSPALRATRSLLTTLAKLSGPRHASRARAVQLKVSIRIGATNGQSRNAMLTWSLT